MKKVLVTGINEEITKVIIRLLGEMDGYSGVASGSIDEMVKILKQDKFDVLLIGAGFDSASEKEMKEKALQIQPEIQVKEHYGGGSGLLRSELASLNK